MRRRHHLLVAEQRIADGGFLDEHVEGGACEMAGIERRDQRRVIDERAARRLVEVVV